ncbi:MAG: SDR family oxidoreductase [Burkholderiales bacterium]|nr:SDR family oxidoreductase [Burkholderiales bacterium]
MARAKARFEGKVVLITGGSGGQGRVQGRMFAEQGATVVLSDVIEGPGKAAVKAMRAAGAAGLFTKLDVTAAASWQQALKRIRRAYGRLDVLVNNAGVVSRTGIRSLPLAEWQRVIAINLTGPMLGIQACAPLMRDSGGGSIVNISSTAGLLGHPSPAYAASKWGLRGVTKSAALDLLDWNIRVNSVHPAQVADTNMAASASPGYLHANERAMPLKRQSRPDEVAQAVLFLASDESSYINAAEIVVDGGAVSIGLPRVRTLLEEDFDQAAG